MRLFRFPWLLSQQKRFFSAPTYRKVPENEGVIHFSSKHHILNELTQNNGKPLEIAYLCGTEGKFWTCKNVVSHGKWIKNWETVKSEFTLEPFGRFDLAVLGKKYELKYPFYPLPEGFITLVQREVMPVEELRAFSVNPETETFSFPSSLTFKRKQFLTELCAKYNVQYSYSLESEGKFITISKKRGIVASDLWVIEVKHTSPMTTTKIKSLREAHIPWIEVEGKESLYKGEKKWTISKPLKVLNCSTKTPCQSCLEAIQETLSLDRIATVIDVHSQEKNSTKLKRIVFSILKSRRDYLKDHYYLVEGSFISINRNVIEIPPTLLLESKSFEEIEKKVTERIYKIYQTHQGTVKASLVWPGESLSSLRERLGHIIGSVTNPRSLYSSLNYIAPMKYKQNNFSRGSPRKGKPEQPREQPKEQSEQKENQQN